MEKDICLTLLFAFAEDALPEYPENPPHAGHDIPSETAGAVEIIAGSGCIAGQLHIKGIADADAALQGNGFGVILYVTLRKKVSAVEICGG